MAGHSRNGGMGGRNRARSALRARRTREAMGEADYDRMIAEQDNRGFAWFGIAFVAVLAIVFFAMSWLGL